MAQVGDGMAPAKFAVLRHVTPRLPHEPHRRDVGALPTARLKKSQLPEPPPSWAIRIVSPSSFTWYAATGCTGGPPRTWPVSSENTPSCQGHVTLHRTGSTVPSDRLARACVQRLAMAYTVPFTLKSATASLAA